MSPNNIIYQKIAVYRTFNNGLTWEEKVVDTLGNGGQPECLKFVNDSTGFLATGSGVYFTKDYGENWQIIDSSYFERPVVLNDNLYVFGGKSTFWYDLETFEKSTFELDPDVWGTIGRTFGHNTKVMTSSYGSDGYIYGYDDYNYISLIIDELPFGDAKNIHIPGVGYTSDIELTDNNLFLVLNGIYRSTNNGDSFFRQTTFEPEGFDSTFVQRCSFPSDTVGYLLTYNQSLGYKIQKTTNTGGVTTDYLPNVVEFTANVDEKATENGIEVFPNPSSDFSRKSPSGF